MSIIQAGLDALARFLGADPATQQDVVYSEASARKALSRRDFLRTAGAVAAGTLFVDRVAEALDAEPAIAAMGKAARSSLAQFDAYLKEMYSESMVREMLERPHPWVAQRAVMPAGAAEYRYVLDDRLDAAPFEIGEMWSWGDGSGKPAGKAVVTGISHERGIITLDSAPRGSV